MKYRIVMGFYPSYKQAEKIKKKALSVTKSVQIKQEKDCYVVVLGEYLTYEQADEYFSFFMNKKLFCGIQSLKDEI